eukprot:Sspe_Gene.30719::Locus_15183_Transcript_2_2_Confidence_1.000_Length_902::g.30719::m.30719/K08770/UBC; ubiquitin C
MHLFVNPSDTVLVLKGRIHEKDGVRPCEQRLIFAGEDLADNRSLSSYNISNGSTVSLLVRTLGEQGDSSQPVAVQLTVPAQPEKTGGHGMRINVQTVEGKAVSLDVEPTTSVAEVKAMLEGKLGVAPSKQQLVFGMTHLEDPNTLEHYSIGEGKVVYLQ